MDVVRALAGEVITFPEPRELLLRAEAPGLCPAVLGPFDLRVLAQYPGLDEGPDVHANAVVQVRLPADGLLVERLPAHEDVVGRLPFEDERELLLERNRRCQAVLGPAFASLRTLALAGDPVAEHRVRVTFEEHAVQLVVVDEGGETVPPPPVPDVPDEGALVEELAVLLEEAVAQPVLERLTAESHRIEEGGQARGVPRGTVRPRKEL